MNFLNSNIGRLRLLAILEGLTLLILVFIAVPLRRIFDYPMVSQVVGPIHGVLFLLFVFNTLSVGVEQGWKFSQTTWKVLLACFVPFGTFYIDRRILKPIHQEER
ncbi:DUF3817 domain-containing protein [Tunicatimonas pelagia]|uniref:DUF3817 domain-containing protein n=1 Tax=Tunicatimonas pelagia TaxID=931531 RepID=UPI0026662FD2|nr:DUF3817 domain-containing protein [Tunicatimonas pelagia]WKN42862.1 DUF3817 domain-containing protein [Tunicatimonas pelagia]